MHNLKRLLRNVFFFLLPKPTVRTSMETLDYILEKRCSVSRYGDGEFNLILQAKDIYFQKADHGLKKGLMRVLKSRTANHIVCIPYTLLDRKILEPTAGFPFWETYWKYNYKRLIRYLDLSLTYFDSLITRPYIDLKDKSGAGAHFDKLKKVFEGEDIYIVEGELSRTGVGNDLFSKADKVNRIICPPDNAYDVYEKIMEVIVEKTPKSALILLCLGPTATVMAHDLAVAGYWAIDLGHIDMEYEWFLMGATSKGAIKNKIVREGEVFLDLTNGNDDKCYMESIIHRIL